MYCNIDRLSQEIENIRVVELYAAYHENRGGHSQEKHFHLTHNDLINRARVTSRERRAGERRSLKHEKNGSPAELQIFSRFTGDRQEMLDCIAEALSGVKNEIRAFLANDMERFEVYYEFSHPIGDGILEEGDWHKLYPLSAIVVVLEPSTTPESSFRVKTAYPAPCSKPNEEGISEVDFLFDELDHYFHARFV